MAKYYWHEGKWVEKKPLPAAPVGPYVQGDLPVYQSPLSFKMIDGRRERREEMKRYDVRELDPSERPEGAGEPKSSSQLKAEQQYMAERAANTHGIPAEIRERLMRGE